MADNSTLDAGSGGDAIVTREITHAGDTAKLGGSFLVGISGAEGSYTWGAINGDATNGLDVDVTRLPALVAGSANIGDVDVLTIAAGDNNIGNVDIASIAAGDNNIGNVDVLSVPADPFGANADAASATGSISAKLRFIAGGIPVTGTVTVGLPSGASTAAKQPALGTAGTASADVITVQGITSMTPILVTLSGTNNIATVTTVSAVTAITNALPAGNNNIGDVDIASAIPAGTNLMGRVNLDPQAANGATGFYNLDVDETEDDVKTSAGTLLQLHVTNRTASVRYLHLYNATAANTTVGSTTPLMTIPIPANASDYTAMVLNFGPYGLKFSTALCIAATTSFADNDAGAPGTNDIIVSGLYV